VSLNHHGDPHKVVLRGPRQVLGGMMLMVTIWVLGPKTWQEILRKAERDT
jgi:hypothetical protein